MKSCRYNRRRSKKNRRRHLAEKHIEVERLIKKIHEAIVQKDWNRVKTLSREILSVEPENPSGLAFLEMSMQQLPEEETETAPDEKPVLSESFVNDRYSVKRMICEGARKKVYLCRDTTLDCEVAFSLVKTEGLDEDARKRVIREAKVMGRLGDHPNIVNVHDIGEEDNQPYIVTAYMDGGDVETLIEEASESRIPLYRILEITKSICRGLEFAHSQTIAHRDLKPSNVWLTSLGIIEQVADPLFMDVEREDYRLNSDSLVLVLGFQSIDVENIGIRSREKE